MTIWVIGNCQARGVARSVTSLTGSNDVQVIDVRNIFKLDDAGIEAMRADIADSDLVLVQKPDDALRGMAAAALEASGLKVKTYPTFVFSGLHPDSHYIRSNGAQLPGPMGTYHSAIVAAAFLEGLGERQTCSLFNAYTYASLGYLGQYGVGMRAMHRRIEDSGQNFEAVFGAAKPFMHTINHPTVDLLFESTKQALASAGVPVNVEAEKPFDELAKSVIWPVYPEIGSSIGLPGTLEFQLKEGEIINLEEFVSRSFAAYREALTDTCVAPAVDRAREFIKSEVKRAA